MTHGLRPPGYRLPEATRVGAVRLQVSDPDRSLAFYTGILGFDVVDQTAGIIGLGAGGPTLIELVPGAKAPLQGKRLGLYHFAILLPDRPALGRCLTHLTAARIRVGAADHLVSEALYLSDPDGLGIEIYRDRPRAEWPIREGQLAMASDPLDFHGVAAEGRDQSWNGMPAGTTIGHVHLHVGDLDRARHFYHEGLGFDLTAWGYPGALFLGAGGYHHHLGTNIWAGPSAAPPAAAEPQLVTWQLVLPGADDVLAATANLRAAGYAPTPEEVGGSVVSDPWSTPVKLVPAATDAAGK